MYSPDGNESNLEADVMDRGGLEIGCGPYQPEIIPEVRSNLAKIAAAPKSFSLKMWKTLARNGETNRMEVRRLPSVCPATKLSKIDPKNIQREASGAPKQMSYLSAISECKSKGMRLPTPREFLAFRATLGGAMEERQGYEHTITSVAGADCIDTSALLAPGTVSWSEHGFPTGRVWLGADVATYAPDPEMGRAIFSTENDDLYLVYFAGGLSYTTLCVAQ